jgi:protease-4
MTKSTKWFLGILSVLALLTIGFVILIIVLIAPSTKDTELVTIGRGEKLAVVEVYGVITSSDDVVRQLKKYREDNSIEGIILRVNSPGGAVVPSQEIYSEVRNTREIKPVIVSMGSLAASGGYYVSCGGTRLVANCGTLTGSIGVISEFLQLHGALDKLGIDVKIIKSGKLKDAGASSRPMTKEDEKYFQTLMDEVHRQFMDVVEKERGLTNEEVLELADGRVFTGEQALERGLVDTLGTYEDAVKIAAAIAGIDGDPALVVERKRTPWWSPVVEEMNHTIQELKEEILNRPILSYRYTGPF